MPKEVTHWLIAQQTARALRGSPLGDFLDSYPNCLMLGAVIHDAPYYVRNRRWKSAMPGFADALHGRGFDPFTVVGSMVKAATRSRHSAPVRALLIGMLSHIAADRCFHPLVYHTTGNYYDPDPAKRSICIQMHRGFETALDVYLAGTLANVTTFSLGRYMRCCELPVSKLMQEAFTPAASDFMVPELPDAFVHCLRVFSRMQSMYAAPVLTRVLELFYQFLPSSGREISALFYLPSRVRQAPGLHGPRLFPDPDTGRTITASVLDLYRRAIELSLGLCRELEPCLLGTQPFKPPQTPITLDYPLQASPARTPGV